MKKLNIKSVPFATHASLPCVSSAAKFTVRIPALEGGGEPIVYPEGHAEAGQPILDYNKQKIGDNGLVFVNPTDHKIQAVIGDGTGIIIINQVTEEGADTLAAKLLELNPDPSTLTLAQLKDWIAFAYASGFDDIYCSSVTFHTKNFTPLGARHHSDAQFGRFKRDARDLCKAVFVEGEVEFADKNGAPGNFTDGLVIVETNSGVHGIRPDKFIETYRNPAGDTIDLATIPVFEGTE